MDAGGGILEDVERASFPTQGEAEAWFSESWQELGDRGVASVTLRRDGEAVYGPMSLESG
ncbi:MAG: hypothetical protein Q4P32_06920 [Micrococcales bacterium]|nr:hypothetical protein [Micrococcales bacterium]